MKTDTENPGTLVRDLIKLQAGVSLVAASGWWLVSGNAQAIAALAGGVAVVLPTLGAAVIALAPSASHSPKRMLAAFYKGEAVKIGMTVALLALLINWHQAHLLPLLTTFVIVTFLYWPALALSGATSSGKTRKRVQQP